MAWSRFGDYNSSTCSFGFDIPGFIRFHLLPWALNSSKSPRNKLKHSF